MTTEKKAALKLLVPILVPIMAGIVAFSGWLLKYPYNALNEKIERIERTVTLISSDVTELKLQNKALQTSVDIRLNDHEKRIERQEQHP